MGDGARGGRATVVTPGNHDGVHVGHRALLAAARALAERTGGVCEVVALTFDPHPLEVLAPERAPRRLTTLERRTELLAGAGADRVVVERFDASLASIDASEWVRRVLVEELGARGLVVGPDFRFGRGRAGDLELLRHLAEPGGFTVRSVEPVEVRGERVSSTRIRALLEAGQVSAAAEFLGRYHDVDGRVVRGDARGRTLGFPTANLSPSEVVLPADGVYAAWARPLDGAGGTVAAVVNVGSRPTFRAGRSVEAHLLDFTGDLYDRPLRLAFVDRLRDERRFESLEGLREQIGRDVGATARRLGKADRELARWI